MVDRERVRVTRGTEPTTGSTMYWSCISFGNIHNVLFEVSSQTKTSPKTQGCPRSGDAAAPAAPASGIPHRVSIRSLPSGEAAAWGRPRRRWRADLQVPLPRRLEIIRPHPRVPSARLPVPGNARLVQLRDGAGGCSSSLCGCSTTEDVWVRDRGAARSDGGGRRHLRHLARHRPRNPRPRLVEEEARDL